MLLLVFLIIVGLVWLAGTILLFLLIYNVVLHNLSSLSNPFLRKTVRRLFLFTFLLSITIGIKLLAFDIYKIPSSSMKNMLYPGDVIVINKLSYGPRLPRSPFDIPLINLFFFMDKDSRQRITDNWWGYYRYSGITEIKQGDVFVFNSSWDKNFILVKRCVGLPGDTLVIKKAEVYVNTVLFNSPQTVRNDCSFRIKDKKLLNKILDSLQVEEDVNYIYGRSDKGSAVFSKQQFDFLQKRNCVDSLRIITDVYNGTQQQLLKTVTSRWTRDDMGPIVIPRKGMKIKLNLENFMLYENVMNQCENSGVSEKNSSFFINGKKAQTYTFKQNYYFMMGDNRKGTMDSRVWGFVPESNVIGKAKCVLFSTQNEDFQWDRVFKMF